MERMTDAIPFGKPVRMGNFKLWMSNYLLSTAPTEAEQRKYSAEYDGKKKVKPKKTIVRCINASVLDGAFSVRIPENVEMFPMLSLAYQWYVGGTEEEKQRGLDYIRTVLSNMLYVSSICNGFYHRGIEMVSVAYTSPSVLRDTEEGGEFRKDVAETIERFLSWYDEYEKLAADGEPTADDIRSDELAEQAAAVLDGKDE